jgi:hypothetical protein
MKRYFNKLTIILGCVFCLSCSVRASGNYAGEPENKRQKLQQEFLSQERSFEFFGKVIDQFETPVSDVNIVVEITYFQQLPNFGLRDRTKRLNLVTDQNGKFEFNDRGCMMMIMQIAKTGYEYTPNRKVDVYSFSRDPLPSKDAPAVFKIRKRNEPVYLTIDRYEYYVKGGQSRTVQWDIVGEWITPTGIALKSVTAEEFANGKTERISAVDLVFEATPAEPNVYDVSLTCPDANGGVILIDNLLYDAPDKGYMPQAALRIEKSMHPLIHPVIKYAYVKGRNGGAYSRIRLLMYIGEDGVLALEGERVTNPAGGHNVDYYQRWQYMEESWLNEVKSARRKAEREAAAKHKPFDEQNFLLKIQPEKAGFIEKVKKYYIGN